MDIEKQHPYPLEAICPTAQLGDWAVTSLPLLRKINFCLWNKDSLSRMDDAIEVHRTYLGGLPPFFPNEYHRC